MTDVVIHYGWSQPGAHHVGGRPTMRTMPPRETKAWSGADVQSLRWTMGITQQTMANLLHISRSCVADWERGESTPTGSYLLLLDLLESHPEMFQAS